MTANERARFSDLSLEELKEKEAELEKFLHARDSTDNIEKYEQALNEYDQVVSAIVVRTLDKEEVDL